MLAQFLMLLFLVLLAFVLVLYVRYTADTFRVLAWRRRVAAPLTQSVVLPEVTMKKIEMYRQGDVLLIRCDSEMGLRHARDITPRDRIVLAYGEVTGHAHAIYPNATVAVAERDGHVGDSDARVEHSDAAARVLPAKLWDAGAERYLQVISRTTLDHEEHASIALEPGTYRVVRQREYDPAVHQRFVED